MFPDFSKLPELSWTDPAQPPLGQDGKIWPWRGTDAPGGKHGAYVNPSNPEQSLHPDLDHVLPIGPHWDYTDRKAGSWRIFPNRTIGRK